jgi:RimJ/RimL family protein N-acetyltransferase
VEGRERVETERFVLRPLRESDLGLYRRLRVRAESARREVEAAVEHWAVHGFGPWAILERGSEEAIGVLEVHLAGPGIGGIEPNEVEIGWSVVPDRRNEGVATEAARAAIADAFARPRARPPHVVVSIRPGNAASLRIVARLGMRDDGEGTTRSGDRMRIFRLPRPTTIDGRE